jgi:hypothetical protein
MEGKTRYLSTRSGFAVTWVTLDVTGNVTLLSLDG